MDKTCTKCGKIFCSPKKQSKYCSRSCYLLTISGTGNPCWRGGKKETVCPICGIKFFSRESRIKSGRGKYCSKRCYFESRKGKKTAAWRGGIYHTTQGYTATLTAEKTYTLNHRLIMEHHLGRKLLSSELVHHINGDKSDNRIENLEIITRAKHCQLHLPAKGHVVTVETREKIRQTLLTYNRSK